MIKAKKQIGVIVPAAIDFGRAVLRGVRTFCKEHGDTRMILVSEGGYSAQTKLPDDLLDCLVVQHSYPADIESLRQQCPNIVVTSNREQVSGFQRVINNDEAIGRMGAAHLISQGYRTLVFVGPEYQFSKERKAGFSATAEEAGCACHLFAIENNLQIQTTIPELLALPGPTAVMAASDLHARWIIEALEDPLSQVPGQLAVIGVDDDSLQNALSSIPISSVCPAGERLGYEAAAMGLRLAEGKADETQTLRIDPKNVVVRQSTDAIVIKDRVVSKTIRLIRDRMGEFEDAADLIKAVGIPRRTLEVKFRKLTGQTLAGELANARIRRARELLANTDLSIKEIAYLVGFSEPRMLTLVFKRITLELPSEYRVRVRPGA